MATQDTNRGINKVLKMQELCKCVEAVANDAPTIDPETLPIVKELRREIDRLTNDGKQDLWYVERKRREQVEEELERLRGALGDTYDLDRLKEAIKLIDKAGYK